MDAFKIVAALTLSLAGSLPQALAAEPQVFSVTHHLNMGNPGEKDRKDYFINAGTKQGIREGAVIQVFRKSPSYDLINNKIHTEVTFPIATLKVIHSEGDIAIARLDKMLPDDKTPAIIPTSVMLGDIVRLSK